MKVDEMTLTEALESLVALSALDTGDGCSIPEGKIVDNFDFSEFNSLVNKCRISIELLKSLSNKSI